MKKEKGIALEHSDNRNEPKRLSRAVVVGGRGYLGRSICNALANFCDEVVSADLVVESKAAEKSADTSNRDHKRVIQRNIDVTDPDSLIKFAAETPDEVDVFVYAATTKPLDFYKPFTACSLDGWKHVIDVELNGLFTCVREFGRKMEQRQSGNIVLISSIYGIVGNDQRLYQGSNLHEVYGHGDVSGQDQPYSHVVYAAVKGAVISLTRYWACYWQGQGIRVNCLSPGGIEHPAENSEFRDKYSAKVPLGRKGLPEEIAKAVSFLASGESSYVNGHNLVVDGGFTSW